MAKRGNPIDNPENFPEYFRQYEPFILIPRGSDVKVSNFNGLNIIESLPTWGKWLRVGDSVELEVLLSDENE